MERRLFGLMLTALLLVGCGVATGPTEPDGPADDAVVTVFKAPT